LKAIFDRFDAIELTFDFQSTPKNGPSTSFFREFLGHAPSAAFTITRSAFERACPPLYHRLKELPNV
jgi:hypothetical protein